MGRESIDIIKSGGYKISSLEIEEALRHHHSVKDVVVIGVTDPEFGEVIASLIIFKQKNEKSEAKDQDAENILFKEVDNELSRDLRTWCGTKLSPYKVPRKFIAFQRDAFPRNALEKVNKKEIRSLLQKWWAERV